MKVLVYNCNFYKIGGLETFVKNFVKRMSEFYDLTCVYESGDYKQLLEISKHAEVVKYNNQSFLTDVCIWVSGWGKRPIEHIKAKKHFQMIHADYKNVKQRLGFEFVPQKEMDGYICVGKEVAKVFKELHGEHKFVKDKPIIVIHNLLDKDIKVEKVLRLITVSRIGAEKGFERVIKMAKMLKASGHKFLWHLWGDIPDAKYKQRILAEFQNIPEMIFMGTRLDIHSFIADADYLVQLSDTEAFCYSIYEALQVGTPCIVTNFPSAYEQIQDGKNGYILDMELSNLDIDKIYKHIPDEVEFHELSTEIDWIKVLGEPSAKHKKKKVPEFKPDTLIVKVLENFIDAHTKRKISKGTKIEINYERYNEILEAEKKQNVKLVEIE